MTDFATVLIESSLRSAVLGGVAWLLAIVMRRNDRTVHAIWASTSAGMLLILLLMVSSIRPAIAVGSPLPRIVTSSVPLPFVSTDRAKLPWTQVRYRQPRSEWRESIVWLWGLGLIAGAMRLATAAASLGRIRFSSVPAGAAVLAHGARSDIPIAISDCVSLPVTAGILRPTIYLPPSSRSWREKKLAAVLAHERAHVDRGDTRTQLVSSIVCAIFWFHPIAWLVARRQRAAAEGACDARGAFAVGRSAYARTLLEIAEESASNSRRGLGPLAVAMTSPSLLRRRVDRLFSDRTPPPRRANAAVPIAVMLGLALLAVAKVHDASSLSANPLFRSLMTDIASSDPQRRADALFCLARWQGREEQAMPILLTSLSDAAPVARMPQWDFNHEGWAPAFGSWRQPSPGEVAALGLASFGTQAAAPLHQMLRSPNAVARRNAAWALGELRHPRHLQAPTLDALEALLRDSDAEVRAAAVWALGDIGEQRSRSAVRIMAAKEHDPRAAAFARETMRALDAGVGLEHLRRPGE